MNNCYYLTTPIYYVNDAPHIGHAYTSVITDILARRARLYHQTYFLTGTDEHGQKIEKTARAKGMQPIDFCNEISKRFYLLTKDFNLSNDDFIRTTEERHKERVKIFWNKLMENGWIYKGNYSGFYSIRDEAFYTESELVAGKAPTGAEVEWHEEESYFFRLSACEEILTKLYNLFPDIVYPASRLNEVKSFLANGLSDLSISRESFKWGIPVPKDERHVIYVWLDALTNYISALSYPDGEKYHDYWLNENNKKVHVIGKDILRFHAVFWPAFLIAEKYMANNINENEVLRFFENFTVVTHGWWKNEGVKISKSLGNTINPYDLVSKFTLDKVRYFFVKSIPFGEDGDFNEKNFIELTNADLANNIGNLAHRVLTFIYNNCSGKISSKSINVPWRNYEADFDSFLFKFEFNKAMEVVMEFGRKCNEFMDKNAPWLLQKEGRLEEMNHCLHVLAIAIFRIYKMLECVMPQTCSIALAIFNNKLPENGDVINLPSPLFNRI